MDPSALTAEHEAQEAEGQTAENNNPGAPDAPSAPEDASGNSSTDTNDGKGTGTPNWEPMMELRLPQTQQCRYPPLAKKNPRILLYQ